MPDVPGLPPALSTLLSGPPRVIAHRGGSRLRPENTMAAFAHALELGVDALECDVHLSRDGEPVIIHDATLDRTTDRTGPVAALTAGELERVDAAYRFAPEQGFPLRGQGIGVSRLAVLLAASRDLPVIVEIKGDDPRAADRTMDIVARAGAAERVIFAGFSHAVLSAVRGRSPAFVTSASKQEVQSAVRLAYLLLRPRRPAYRVFQAPLRFGNRQVLTRALVRGLIRAGVPSQAWIVDEESEMRMLLDWGVKGIISDRPDVALRVVRGGAAS
jgi:glycerophosphoryl diester phosphodiesterase